MGNIHTETYNAFKQAGVPEEPAQRAAIAIAGEQSAIMAAITAAGDQSAIMEKLNKMESDIDKRFTKLQKDIRENIHSLDKKFLIITTVMSSTLPIIGGLLVFVLRGIS